MARSVKRGGRDHTRAHTTSMHTPPHLPVWGSHSWTTGAPLGPQAPEGTSPRGFFSVPLLLRCPVGSPSFLLLLQRVWGSPILRLPLCRTVPP